MQGQPQPYGARAPGRVRSRSSGAARAPPRRLSRRSEDGRPPALRGRCRSSAGEPNRCGGRAEKGTPACGCARPRVAGGAGCRHRRPATRPARHRRLRCRAPGTGPGRVAAEARASPAGGKCHAGGRWKKAAHKFAAAARRKPPRPVHRRRCAPGPASGGSFRRCRRGQATTRPARRAQPAAGQRAIEIGKAGGHAGQGRLGQGTATPDVVARQHLGEGRGRGARAGRRPWQARQPPAAAPDITATPRPDQADGNAPRWTFPPSRVSSTMMGSEIGVLGDQLDHRPVAAQALHRDLVFQAGDDDLAASVASVVRCTASRSPSRTPALIIDRPRTRNRKSARREQVGVERVAAEHVLDRQDRAARRDHADQRQAKLFDKGGCRAPNQVRARWRRFGQRPQVFFRHIGEAKPKAEKSRPVSAAT